MTYDKMRAKPLPVRVARFVENCARFQLESESATGFDVSESYEVFIRENREAFFAIPVDTIFSNEDRYNGNSKALFRAIDAGCFYVYTGGNLPDKHPLAFPDYGICRVPSANVVFRAVHDYYGHYLNRLGFSTLAELTLAAKANYSAIALDAFLSETVLQTCYYHIFGEYAEQKTLHVPVWLRDYWQDIRAELNGQNG